MSVSDRCHSPCQLSLIFLLYFFLHYYGLESTCLYPRFKDNEDGTPWTWIYTRGGRQLCLLRLGPKGWGAGGGVSLLIGEREKFCRRRRGAAPPSSGRTARGVARRACAALSPLGSVHVAWEWPRCGCGGVSCPGEPVTRLQHRVLEGLTA